jgi:hypothetical protein
MGSKKFRAPRLPNAPPEYSRSYFDNFFSLLSTYFNQLDSSSPQQAESYTADNFYGPTTGLTCLHNTFVSTVSQSIGAPTTSQLVELSSAATTYGITLESGNRLVVQVEGTYELTYSLQLCSTSAHSETIDVWVKKNGTDVAYSNRKHLTAHRRSGSIPSYNNALHTIIISVAVGDYLQLVWYPSETTVTLSNVGVGSSPTVPATHSVVINTKFISA